MGKKTSWFGFLKRLFVSKSKSSSTANEKQDHKKWRWAFHRLELRQYPSLQISSTSQRLLKEAREEQRKQALAVAMATAAAAKAAVAAANAAAEVVEFLGVPESYIEHLNEKQIFAATRIQSAYRAFLARKALRALKGLVRLQAIVRGRIARRRSNILKYLPHSLAKNNSSSREGENACFLGEKQLKLNCKSNRSWDYSIFSKEDLEALQLRKQEATNMRDRMKKYSSSQRERRINDYLENSMIDKGRMMSPLLEVVGAVGIDGSRKRELAKSRSTVSSNFIEAESFIRMQSRKEEPDSPISLPRRSFTRTDQKSVTNESCMVNSPALPTYMAATESVKAKSRSASTPSLRLGTYDQDFPYKPRIF